VLFNNAESAKKFYKDYAHDLGFSIRTGQQRLDGNGVVEWKRFLCSRAGYRKKRKKLNTTILPRRARRHAELDRLDVDAKLIFM